MANPWDEQYEPSAKEESTSKTSSFAQGAAQEATLGFADEIEGALRGAGDILTGDAKLKDIAQAYRNRRDHARARDSKAKRDNPGTYTAGQVAGAVASTVLAPELKLAQGVGLAAKAARAATVVGRGAIEGVGKSEADSAAGMAKDAASTAVTQGLLHGVAKAPRLVPGAGYVAEKVAEKLPETLKKGAKVAGESAARAAASDMSATKAPNKESTNPWDEEYEKAK